MSIKTATDERMLPAMALEEQFMGLRNANNEYNTKRTAANNLNDA
jgi:hypothetical protein